MPLQFSSAISRFCLERSWLILVVVAISFFALPTEALVHAQEAAGDGAADAPKESLLMWLVSSLGWGYILIFLSLSFILVALFIMNVLSARRDYVCPRHLIEGFEAHLDEKQYQEAYELAKADESFLGNVLAAGLAKLSSSYQHAHTAMEEVGEEENMKLDHRLSYLALIGTISPMIGLFGTVYGMILAFTAIVASGGAADPVMLAGGIGTALTTTFWGLVVAIPSLAACAMLRGHIDSTTAEATLAAEELLGGFRPKKGNGGASAS